MKFQSFSIIVVLAILVWVALLPLDDWRLDHFEDLRDILPAWLHRLIFPVAIVVITLFAIASSFWVNVPTPITPNEKRSIGVGAFSIILGPVVIAIGVTFLFFPMDPPMYVALSSRSRSPEDSQWETQFREKVKERFRDRKLIDAGLIVDNVCSKILQLSARNEISLVDFGNNNRQVEELVRDELIHGEIQKHTSNEASVTTKNLPAWLIQSIELTVLRILSTKQNVANILWRFPDSSSGDVPWSYYSELLSNRSSRLHEIDTLLDITDDEMETALVSVSGTSIISGSNQANVYCVILNNSASTKDARLVVEDEDRNSITSDVEKIATRGLSVTRFAFANASNVNFDKGAFAYLSFQKDGKNIRSFVARSIPRDPRRQSVLRICFDDKGHDWQSVFKNLTGVWKDEKVDDWRRRMESVGISLPSSAEPNRILTSDRANADIVVTAASAGGFFIHDKSLDRIELDNLVVAHASRPNFARIRTSAASLPGVLSLSELQFAPNTKFASLASKDVELARVEYIHDNLSVGTDSIFANPFSIIEKSRRVVTLSGGGTKTRTLPIIFFGWNPESTNMLPMKLADVDESCLTSWSNLLFAIYEIQSQKISSLTENSTDRSMPRILLAEDDFELNKSRALSSSLKYFSLGILIFAIFLYRTSQNKRGKKQ